MTIYHVKIAQLKQKGVESNRKIAEMLGISRNTVNSVVRQISEAGLSFQEVSTMSDDKAKEVFRTAKAEKNQSDYVVPDYKKLAKELSKPGVTVQLLFEEYQDSCRLMRRRGYQRTQFREHLKAYLNKMEFKDILKHKAGEQIQVDWAGERPFWQDPDTGEIVYGYLFGGILPFSGLAFAYVTPNMKMESWIKCHVKMFEYFGGSARILTPDNLKTGITKHAKDEIIVNRTYEDMAEFYSTVVIPTRVRSPRDKSLVENLMLRFEQTIIGRLRNYQFFSIQEYNEAVLEEVERFNNKPFQKKEGTRRQLFEQYERETLTPLPAARYEIAYWRNAKVQANSHISIEKNYYSVPYEYIGKTVKVKQTYSEISVYYNNQLLCKHSLCKNRIGTYVTDEKHMPPNSNAAGEWNSARYLNWAKSKGQYVYIVVYKLFGSVNVEQKRYRTVHSILKLADKYTDSRLNEVCKYLLSIMEVPGYRDIKRILETKEDLRQDKASNDNCIYEQQSLFERGGDYFG